MYLRELKLIKLDSIACNTQYIEKHKYKKRINTNTYEMTSN